MTIINVAIFISGYGSNALNIIEFFDKNRLINIRLLLSNNKNSYALKKAKEMGVETVVFNNDSFKNNDEILRFLQSKNINFIVLAGFLRLIPNNIIEHYGEKVINIHPSLLPKFGGKGMYGKHVHLAVLASGDRQSGITIHFVNNVYDDGQIIFQDSVVIKKEDTLDVLTKKIHDLEYKHYPKVIEEVINSIFFNSHER